MITIIFQQDEWNYLELFSRQACYCSRCEGIGDCKYLHLFQKKAVVSPAMWSEVLKALQ